MSYQEKRAIASLISTILSSILYFVVVYQRYQGESLNTTEEFRFWAAVIILFVPVQVVSKIIVFIIFAMLNYIATQEEEPSIFDELDRLIDSKATLMFYHVFMGGFFLSMAALALKVSPTTMFTMLCATIVTAGVILDLSQLYFYRRGV